MKKFIYILIILLVVSFAQGCVSKNDLESLQDEVKDWEDDIEDMQDANAELAQDIEKLTAEKDYAAEYNKEILQLAAQMRAEYSYEYSFTFQEYYAQLLYLADKSDMFVFTGPMAMQLYEDDYTHYVLSVSVNDETCMGLEVHIFANKESMKVVQVSVIIYQDEVYRLDVSAYGRAYQTITEMAAVAVLMAEHAPFVIDFDFLGIVHEIQAGNKDIWKEYDIYYDVEKTDEYEERYFMPMS